MPNPEKKYYGGVVGILKKHRDIRAEKEENRPHKRGAITSSPSIKRLEAARKKEDSSHSERAEKILQKYDNDNSGSLDMHELRKLLVELNNGKRVDDEEVRYIMAKADLNHSGAIEMNQIKHVLKDWDRHMQAWPDIKHYFHKHNLDMSTGLNKEELRNLLVDLNDGEDVCYDDVDWVMYEADILGNGVINKPELQHAISAWYAEAEPAKNRKSSVCSLL
eukprot:gnl/TRDRNA2_/TRDRNA2_191455_c0_seq1.p1 gnl/TRDRNA2_/TRDRNA2_191455_c0~~gnl/TRDRNA2_/TRDRNA2_191455_c0_seq1.p1  ORF type:complete len:220 (-),score=48.84 gnl/TRDRNA2_/TRDRNA2_191455_c0_seq1:310-969(-)